MEKSLADKISPSKVKSVVYVKGVPAGIFEVSIAKP